MTLSQFRADFTEHSIETAAKMIGIDTKDFDGNPEQPWTQPVAVMVNTDTLFIEKLPHGWFHTIAERDECFGDWDTVSAWLYFEWYATECIEISERTTDSLCDLLEEWSRHEGVPPSSADEMLVDPRIVGEKPLHEKTANHYRRYRFLEWFCETWEIVQKKEDDAYTGAIS